MPTTYRDQFFTFDPANPPPGGTAVTVSSLNLTDVNDDNLIDAPSGDTVNGQDVTNSWPGDTVTINVSGVGNVTYTGTTFYLADGSRVFTPTDNQVLQPGTLVSTTFVNTSGPLNVGNLGPPCFTAGTMIATPEGERAVEDLKAGDLVITVDHGPQPLIWIGSTTVAAEGKLAPIRFDAGVFGLDRPLLVSPQHRMLIEDWQASYLFGHTEALVPAHTLVNDDTVTRVEGGEVEYFHLLFKQHEIVIANGAKSESYYPGHALSASDRETQSEVLHLFPELTGLDPMSLKTARPIVHPREARVFAI
ncbi:Hint domain-containing protein [Ruegeria sp. YS9]|uniref:Hint domain-containing protein n=1 Tax=Ruegeria sp. YS9 TaxID=2966453 RepID=UPI00214C87D4|nr:Hint domain-containing protein [Ruegeria sp. YS9]UUV05932.1 Hint domain-containing protein [Ruegeria sp. YS9]